jgi:hypothetical protein
VERCEFGNDDGNGGGGNECFINSKRWKRKMDGLPCFRPNIRPQKPARGGRKKWMDPMFQAQYSTPKTSKRWKRKMDLHGPGLILDPKNQQKMEE